LSMAGSAAANAAELHTPMAIDKLANIQVPRFMAPPAGNEITRNAAGGNGYAACPGRVPG